MLGVDEFIADTIEDLKGKIPGKAIIACSGVLPEENGSTASKMRFVWVVPRTVGRDVGHVLLLVGAAGLVQQRVEAAHGGSDGAVLAGGYALGDKIDILILDAALLKEALRLLGVERLLGAKNLHVHLLVPPF